MFRHGDGPIEAATRLLTALEDILLFARKSVA